MTRVAAIGLVLLALAGCKRSANDIACGPKGATYRACGCGCCGEGSLDDDFVCVDTGKGETLESIREHDRAARGQKICATVGCSRGRLYKCCS